MHAAQEGDRVALEAATMTIVNGAPRPVTTYSGPAIERPYHDTLGHPARTGSACSDCIRVWSSQDWVDQTSASWNRLAALLRQLDRLREPA